MLCVIIKRMRWNHLFLLVVFLDTGVSGNLCPQNCAECEASGKICLACQDGFQINVFGQCQENRIEKCAIYGSQGQCIRCQPIYGLSQGKCIRTYSGCMETGRNQECLECGFGLAHSNQMCVGVFNCEQPSQQCSRCVSGYRLWENKCLDSSPGCGEVREDGLCSACREGYFLSGHKCFQSGYEDVRCYMKQSRESCAHCKNGYTLSEGRCLLKIEIKQSGLCRSHNLRTGACFDCQSGLTLIEGKCLDLNCFQKGERACARCKPGFKLDQKGVCRQADSNCLESAGGKCRECSTGFFLHSSGSCRELPANCKTVNLQTEECLECIPNFSSQQPEAPCLRVQQQQLMQYFDPNCHSYHKGVCVECQDLFYLAGGRCVVVNPLCKTSNSRGLCQTCYTGYTMQEGICRVPVGRDLNCKVHSGHACSECYSGYYLSPSGGQCEPLNPFCKTSNFLNGLCTSCYSGYRISPHSGICEVFFTDPNCIHLSAQSACMECRDNFYLSTGECVAASPLCRHSHPVTGECTACYPGYELEEGNCKIKIDSKNCELFQGSQCVSCFKGYYMSGGKCQEVNTLCQTYYHSNGWCKTCYLGYQLSGGQCILSVIKDPNCKKSDLMNLSYCFQCYQGYLALSGRCKKINPLCKTVVQNTGVCQSCYKGYSLAEGLCQLQASTASTPSDPYCLRVLNGVCTRCSRSYYYSRSEQRCSQVDPACKTHDSSNGDCLSCYSGSTLERSRCVVTRPKEIENCLQMGLDGKCKRCLQVYYLDEGRCQPVSILCATYDTHTGACTSCIPSYFLQDGQCIFPAFFDPHCTRYSNSFCVRCKDRFYLQNYLCEPVDSQCLTFDFNLNHCLECSDGTNPHGPKC